jgi:hypothetical protein
MTQRLAIALTAINLVLLCLTGAEGRSAVKLGARQDASGLLLVDEGTEPGIHLVARRTGTTDSR